MYISNCSSPWSLRKKIYLLGILVRISQLACIYKEIHCMHIQIDTLLQNGEHIRKYNNF